MIQPWQQGIITRVVQESPNTRRYWIELPETPVFDFKPGQFVTLDLPISEQRNKRWRSYSIASAPDGSNTLELVISLVPEGAGSNYIFREWEPGFSTTLRGPQGIFTLPPQLDTDVLFICTGTGVAPFRSMLRDIYNKGIPHHHLHLFFGSRTKADLLYHDELKELEGKLENFHYHPTLSREDWPGAKGYVHALYEAVCRNCPPALFYLCGWRMVVDEARQRILDMGYDKKQIHLELYA